MTLQRRRIFAFGFEWRLGWVCIVVVWGWLGWIGFHYIVHGLGLVIQWFAKCYPLMSPKCLE